MHSKSLKLFLLLILIFLLFRKRNGESFFASTGNSIGEKVGNFFAERFKRIGSASNIPSRSKSSSIDVKSGESLTDFLINSSTKTLGDHQKDGVLIQVFGKHLVSTKIRNISLITGISENDVSDAFQRFGVV